MSLRNVGIVGVGLVPFDNYENVTVEDIAIPAIVNAMRDAVIDRTDVGGAFFSHLYK